MVAHLKLLIAKLKRDRFGPSSEHRRRLLDQLELQLEELEATATEDTCTAELATEAAAARKAGRDDNAGRGITKPARAPLPAHLPRERVVIPAPSVCPCCQGKLVKLGENVTETLEVIPAMEGDPDRPREVHLPVVREDRPTAGAVPSHRPRPGRRRTAGDGPLRQVR
jgi:transposase